jgi:hypothetical protein
MRSSAVAAAWPTAVSRVLDREPEWSIGILRIAISAYDLFPTDSLRDLIGRLGSELSDASLSGCDKEDCLELLDGLTTSRLPPNDLARLKKTAIDAVAEMLANCDDEIDLDDIPRLVDALFENGGDVGVVNQAATSAVSQLAKRTRSLLSGIYSIEELEHFEETIMRLILRFGGPADDVAYHIDQAREDCRGRETITSSRYVATRPPTGGVGISDDEIRSLFAGLISEDPI